MDVACGVGIIEPSTQQTGVNKMSSYNVIKRTKVNGKFITLYLSTTGKWIKSSGGASCYCYEKALAVADQNQANVRVVTFRD
jgi:hypothetical protein